MSIASTNRPGHWPRQWVVLFIFVAVPGFTELASQPCSADQTLKQEAITVHPAASAGAIERIAN